jgi:hypothetical protein
VSTGSARRGEAGVESILNILTLFSFPSPLEGEGREGA